MLLIDDILLFPVHGILFCFRGIRNAAQQEIDTEPERIKNELMELYMMLETNHISQEEFDAREKILLDRLEKVQESNVPLSEQKDSEREIAEERG